jgi:hypothetical protein
MASWQAADNGPEIVTASEIACYAYCPEQWRLHYGLGLDPANRAALAAGNRRHWWKAISERIAGSFIGLGRKRTEGLGVAVARCGPHHFS